MRILQVMPEFGLAGAEIMCENLTYELVKMGNEVQVVSLYEYHSAITDRLASKGIDVLFLGKKRGLDFALYNKIRKIIKSFRPEVIHTHRYVMFYVIPVVFFSKRIKKVHTIHSEAKYENNTVGRFFASLFYRRAGVVPVALSELIKGTIVAEYGLPVNRIPVVYNGIDLSKCRPKHSYALTERFNILHIGRIASAKNHQGLLRAFKHFHDINPNTDLSMIGNCDKVEWIHSFIKDNCLQDSVHLLGTKDNVYDYLYSADVFVLPSFYEGMPMTLIEAMGTGLPIIASNVGGIPNMLENQRSALLISPSDDELVSALQTLLDDESLRRKLGECALKDSVRFSSKTMAESYLGIYKSSNDIWV